MSTVAVVETHARGLEFSCNGQILHTAASNSGSPAGKALSKHSAPTSGWGLGTTLHCCLSSSPNGVLDVSGDNTVSTSLPRPLLLASAELIVANTELPSGGCGFVLETVIGAGLGST